MGTIAGGSKTSVKCWLIWIVSNVFDFVFQASTYFIFEPKGMIGDGVSFEWVITP